MACSKMPAKGTKKKIVITNEIASQGENIQIAPLVVASEVVPPQKKKAKKQPKIVAMVTPDGIEGSFLPEPRRPLIAHLQITSTEVNFQDNPLVYDPNPPQQPEPYDAVHDNLFSQHNAYIQDAVESPPVVDSTTNYIDIYQEDDAKEKEPVMKQPAPSLGIDAFTKCELMVDYRDLKETKRIPESTKTACFWCAHTFTWKPSIIPEREEKGTYRVYGNFCSPNCCMAFLLKEPLDTHVRWERIALLHRLYGKHYSNGRIFPSPPRESLELFGGPMNIDTYRSTIVAGKVRIDIQVPPMVSILGSIDTKPIDFYDSSMKHTISPLLGEMLPKAEEGLRLKRSKPLKEKDSTLDSVLKIKIKGRE